MSKEYFCVISQEVSKEERFALQQAVGEVILFPPDRNISESVRCHPDMIFAVLDGKLFLSREYYLTNTAIVDKIARFGGFDVAPMEGKRGAEYPLDVGFNAAVGRDFIICRVDVVCPSLLNYAKSRGYRIIPVKQGYAGCSCIVTDAAVLTFDLGIAAALKKHKIPVLPLHNGGIMLPGYNCGFLGGAGGFSEGTVYLLGNAETLPCYADLRQFADKNKYKIVSLANNAVTDYGGIKIFQKR